MVEKGEKQIITPGSPHGEDESSKYLVLKTRGAKFHEFLQPVSHKAWNFKNQRAWLWESPDGDRKLSLYP